MHRIDQIIFAIDLIDIDVIVVRPVRRPRIVVHPVVAAVVEAAIFATRYAKPMLAAEVRVKVLLVDAARVAISPITLRLLILLMLLVRDLLLLLLLRDLLLFCSLLLLLLRRLLLLPRRV